MVKLAIWNSDYISVRNLGGSGGMPPQEIFEIRPSKGESESIFSSFSVENNGISVYISFKFYFSIITRLIASYYTLSIILFVTTKHLDIASYMPNVSAPLIHALIS